MRATDDCDALISSATCCLMAGIASLMNVVRYVVGHLLLLLHNYHLGDYD
jgi:hypothetical protein